MATIPESVKDLLEKPLIATLTTIAPDGIPENTAVWVLWDGDYAYVNTADGRRKPDNIRNNPNVAVFLIDPENNQRWLDIRGVVESINEDENYDNINALAKHYTGSDTFYGGVLPADQAGTVDRLVIKIEPLRIASQG